MIYEVKVRVVQEGTVFVEAKNQDEAKKAATRDSVVSKPGFADIIEYYADEIYNADSTVDKSEIEIIKAEDVLGKDPINQRSTKIAEVKMMKSSNKSINSQRKSISKDAVVAFLSLLVFALLLGFSSSISSYDFDKQSELSARCRSMGGEMGNGKCFKDRKEI